jgi:hypothetical protein
MYWHWQVEMTRKVGFARPFLLVRQAWRAVREHR